MSEYCGFNGYLYEKTPLEKQQFIQGLKDEGKIVMMVGDGINDAPALSKADIGISVLSASDLSIQISDILLTQDKFSLILFLKDVGSVGRKVVKLNLFWAFFYNVVGIGLAALGLLSPLFAITAMVLSSGLVVFNALRLPRCVSKP